MSTPNSNITRPNATPLIWSDKHIWKQCFVSTIICLIGCSIGAMGTAFYLIDYNFYFVLLISLVVGFISCLVFMVIWNVLFRQMNLKDALKSSYKMSIISILIMMITENIVIILIAPKFTSHHMAMDSHSSHGYSTMIFAMSLGFLFSLPYNYYHLQKTGKICH